MREGQRQAFRKTIDGDHALGAQEVRALDRELANRPAPPHGDGVAGTDAAVLRGHVAGGEDVGEEQHLLVGQRVGHLDRPDVRERHARVLGLASGIAAVHVRIAEQARPRVAADLFGHPRVGVRVVAERPELLLAEVAAAAGNRERHDDAIADFEVAVLATDLDDLAHELVAEDVALLHRRDIAAVDVEIGSTDRGCSDFHDRVARVQQLGIRDVLDADIFFAVVADGFHRRSFVAGAAACAISPASRICLSSRRSSRIVCEGSRPNNVATNAPAFPAGGAY